VAQVAMTRPNVPQVITNLGSNNTLTNETRLFKIAHLQNTLWSMAALEAITILVGLGLVGHPRAIDDRVSQLTRQRLSIPQAESRDGIASTS
jgi:hypothetical protein